MNTTVDLVSDEETFPVQKKIKESPKEKCVKKETSTPARSRRNLKNELDTEKDSKSNVKDEVKKTAAKKRPPKKQLTSPAKKKPKLEPDGENKKKTSRVKTEKVKKEDESPEDISLESSAAETSKFQPKLQFGVEWRVEHVIADKLNLPPPIIKNVVRLFENENTIPFIARYRKEQTGNMEPEMLRRVKDNYERLLSVKQKIDTVAKSITKLNKMTPSILAALQSSQTMNEIEHIYAQFKPSGARTLAEKARALGLESPAMAILEGTSWVNPTTLVNSQTGSLEKVLQGLQHIIADVISKNKAILDTMRELYEKNKYSITVESKRAKTATKADEKKAERKAATTSKAGKKVDEFTAEKFQMYFEWKSSVGNIKPHQVLAILRGESLKVLSVKINVPDWFLQRVKQTCERVWLMKGIRDPSRFDIVQKAIEDSYNRLLQPHVVRQIRSDLMEEAHLASIEVFASNLKHLLLTPPFRGKVVMGIDPGFTHGCKLAVVNTNGEVLKTDVMYLHSGKESDKWKHLIRSLLMDHSPVAKQEFPELDPNVISAVSLARRLQEPLSELVKVEPKHLGVGMYQHDIPEKKLSATLNEVVVECVSFVGVDVNTASETLLRHVAGLNATRASNIIDWRTKKGPFLNRDQLHLVKGVGPKSFEQCAGFLRIISETSSSLCFGDLKSEASTSKGEKKVAIGSENAPNPLDRTWIHPESYVTVYWFLELCDLTLSEFGSEKFLSKIRNKVEEIGLQKIALSADVSEARLKLIVDGLTQKPDYDFRSQFQKPLFRSSICTVNDLVIGSTLTGRVQNVTHFGAFVDVGVGNDGLIHISQMRNTKLQVGDRVEVVVLNVEIGQRRSKIGLSLARKV
ncbi:S1 RNA-binding domain-containing protein 1 [Gryllus bimaculatus]|nr:S1 RNA-binding domain-containing protein 1 [Gryllus bimaculatus]